MHFHGSSMSILQFPSSSSSGVATCPPSILNPDVSGKTAVGILPPSYTVMEEVSLPKDDVVYVPELNVNNWLKSPTPPLEMPMHYNIHMCVIPCLITWVSQASRVEIVWDVYKEDILKRKTRETRGSDLRRRVTKIPGNFDGFRRVDSNKKELFTLISIEIENLQLPPGKSLNHVMHITSYSLKCA